MKNILLTSVSINIVLCIILINSVEAGRIIKRPGAVLAKSTIPQPSISEDDDVETENVESTTEFKKVKETVLVEIPNEVSKNSTETEQKIERPSHGKRRKPCNHTNSTQIAQVPQHNAPAHYRYPPSAYRYRLPPTMYQTYYRNRYRKQSISNGTTPSIFPHLQKVAVDMARGILSGMGWDTGNWEMKLLQKIIELMSKDMLFLLQLFV